MGWYSGYPTKQGVIREVTRDATWPLTPGDPDFRGERVTLRHCYRGNRFSGVLWAVQEARRWYGPIRLPIDRWILCCIMECRGGDWAYKDITESMGPCQWSCPLAYLEMVPPDKYDGCNEPWREGVREYHVRSLAKRRQRRQQRKALYG